MGEKSFGWLSDCSLMVDEYRYIDNKIKSGLAEDAQDPTMLASTQAPLVGRDWLL